MSKYTTGEIAALCNVSVRTVQYYDTCGLLAPSELTEGGRRLYCEEDYKRLQAICFLRELNFSIKNITQLFNEENSEEVILLLIETREKELNREVSENLSRIKKLKDLKNRISQSAGVSVESIGDIVCAMENKKKMRRLHMVMLLTAVPITALQWASVILWIAKDVWWLFALYVLLLVPYAFWISDYYFKRAAYICPHCHSVFKPSFKTAFWAKHTPNTRKLTCPECNHKSYCVEVYDENYK